LKSHVYVLLHRDGSHLKVGKADDVIARAGIIGSRIFDLRQSFALEFPSGGQAGRAERALHKLFHQWRRDPHELDGSVPADGRTEWFRADCFERVLSFARQNIDILGCRIVDGVELQAALASAVVEAAAEPKSKTSAHPSPHLMADDGGIAVVNQEGVKKSARSRLLEIPDVFSVAELALVMGVPRAEASQYLSRWKAVDLVVPFGGKSGIYLNAARIPSARSDGALWQRALLKAMPSAVIGGWEVLADSGLTTQVTRQHYILVSNTDSFFEVDGAEVHRRSIPWLNRLVREGAILNPEPGVLAPRLRPGAALADLALYSERKVDPGDIDMDMVEPDEVALFRLLSKADAVEEVTPKRRMRPR